MSSRDTITERSQPQRNVVVYETSAFPPDTLGSRLKTTAAETTVQTVSDPTALVETLADSTVDCLVCPYGAETTVATESLYELLSTTVPRLPRVGYVGSPEALTRAHDLGFQTVHCRREVDDLDVLAERVRAAIETTPAETAADPDRPQLVAAEIDTHGAIHRAAGQPLETLCDDEPTLWTVPWAPPKAAIEAAISQAIDDLGHPAAVGSADSCEMVIIAEPATATRTNGETATRTNGETTASTNGETAANTSGETAASTNGEAAASTNGESTSSRRLTVLAALYPDTEEVDPTLDDTAHTRTIDHEIVDELDRTLPTTSGVSVSSRDVTDRTERTTELERYEQILETVSDGVYALDAEGHFTYVNEGLAELTGYSRSELVGSHVSIFKSESTVERAETALREQIRQYTTDTAAPSELSLDLEIETAAGQSVACTDHIALLPFNDQFRGSVGTLRDVSAQRQREQTLSGLLTVTRGLMSTETAGDVAELVVEAVSAVLGHDRAVVHLLDEESGHLLPEAATDPVYEDVDTLSTAVAAEGPVGSVFDSGTARRYDPAEAAGTEFATCTELVSVPLGGYGTLTVGTSETSAFTESDRQLIQLLTANAEEALNRTKRRQTLQRYELILESVQEMMCVVDSTGTIKLVTDPLATRLGVDRSDLTGHQLSAILSTFHDDSPAGPLAELFETASTTDITFKDSLVGAETESIPVSVEASQLPAVEGRPEAVITIHDISDLISAKEAAAAERERFTYLFENLTDPVDEISVRTDEPTIKAVNRAFRGLFGQPASPDESTATNTAPPVALTDQQIIESKTHESLRAEFDSETDRELKVATTEGTKYFLYRSVPYDLEDGLRGFEIYTDITALKQREIQLQVLHRLLRHNLRNDLNVIEGFAELLKTELDDDQHQQFAARIQSNATQLVELSETAKTIEEVAGHRSLDREPIAIGDLVRSTVETCAQTYDDAEIYLEALSETAVSAGPHLETAIAELIENAIEHNDSEPPRVSISVDVDAETATVTISDNGPGIPPEEWAVVTGDKEISQLEHGSGLGLWLVRWVTEGYGGELTNHCHGEGSTISIQLPRAEGDR